MRNLLLIFIGGFILLGSHAQTENELKAIWEDTNQTDSMRLVAANDLIFDHLMYASPAIAIQEAKRMLDFAKNADMIWAEGNAWNVMGNAALFAGNYELCDSAYSQSGIVARELRDTSRIIVYLNNHGRLKKQRGEYLEALKMFREGRELSAIIEAPAAYFSALGINEATVLAEYGDFEEASKIISTVVEAARAQNDTLSLLNSLVNSGVIYSGQLADSAALNSYTEALSVAIAKKKEFTQCQVLMNLASVELRLGNLDLSKELLAQSLEKSQTNDFLNMEGLIYAKMGDYFLETGQPELAKSKFDLAESIQRREDFLEDVPNSLLGKAEAFLRLEDFENGIKTANEALLLTRSLDNYTESKDAHYLLYQLFDQLPQYDSALYHHLAYTSIKDSIMDRSTKSSAEYYSEMTRLSGMIKIAELERDLISSEKKRQASNFLFILVAIGIALSGGILGFVFYKRKQEAVSKQREAQLKLERAQSEMKALKSQMHPHFIYGVVRSIKNFILRNNAEEAMEHLDKFSVLMRRILENSEYDEVTIKDEVEALELYIELESLRAKKPFSYEIKIGDSINQEDDSIPPLILQPFVENSIWHGLLTSKREGHIEIRIERVGNAIKCSVNDNGIGREASAKLLDSFPSKKKSMAMKIARDRLSLRDQRTHTTSKFEVIDLKDDKGNSLGTKVELTLPDAI